MAELREKMQAASRSIEVEYHEKVRLLKEMKERAIQENLRLMNEVENQFSKVESMKDKINKAAP